MTGRGNQSLRTGRGGQNLRRRAVLSIGAGTLAALAGCSGGGSTPTPTASYDDWFEGVDNFETEVDRTGRDETEVSVGADDGLAYAPAAVRVDPGTTVRWVWTGNGGGHNVVAEDGSFQSELFDEEEATFEHEFTAAGITRYYCAPHRTLGMKGGVRVVA